MLPGVASLKTLGDSPAGDPARRPFVGFGDPWFSEEQASAAASQAVSHLTSRGAVEADAAPVALRALPNTRAADSAVLGHLPSLPETADELQAIAAALGSVDIYRAFMMAYDGGDEV